MYFIIIWYKVNDLIYRGQFGGGGGRGGCGNGEYTKETTTAQVASQGQGMYVNI
jgi:hypothetical protein